MRQAGAGGYPAEGECAERVPQPGEGAIGPGGGGAAGAEAGGRAIGPGLGAWGLGRGRRRD